MAEPRRSSSTPIDARGARFLVVEARFYDDIGAKLFDGAKRAFEAAGAKTDVIRVPGALEIPIAMAMALGETRYDGAVALGCIIRGETYHFEIVANESARALTQLAVDRRLPFGNGILTVETERQALERADPGKGGQGGDKGGDAARAALALWQIKQSRSKQGKDAA